MVKTAAEHIHQMQESMKGGNGTVEIIRTMQPGEYDSKIKLLGRLIIRPGCSLGYHTHEGEEEIVHILSGDALYSDDGAETVLHAGDSCVCRTGHGHSIACPENAAQPLEVYAVIAEVSE
jgi:quercetin dioxygenase-like cupin family protein